MLNAGKILMMLGALVFFAGALLFLGNRFGLGRLPGDVSFGSGNTRVFFPIATSILLSIGLTVLLNILLRFLK